MLRNRFASDSTSSAQGSSRDLSTNSLTSQGDVAKLVKINKNTICSANKKKWVGSHSVLTELNTAEENILATFINEEKAHDYLHLSAPIAEASNSQEPSSIANVINNLENPKIEKCNSLFTYGCIVITFKQKK